MQQRSFLVLVYVQLISVMAMKCVHTTRWRSETNHFIKIKGKHMSQTIVCQLALYMSSMSHRVGAIVGLVEGLQLGEVVGSVGRRHGYSV